MSISFSVYDLIKSSLAAYESLAIYIIYNSLPSPLSFMYLVSLLLMDCLISSNYRDNLFFSLFNSMLTSSRVLQSSESSSIFLLRFLTCLLISDLSPPSSPLRFCAPTIGASYVPPLVFESSRYSFSSSSFLFSISRLV
jgi:hypothetical protein